MVSILTLCFQYCHVFADFSPFLLLQLADEAPESFSLSPAAPLMEMVEKEKEIVICRQPGEGLGISIAGGKGSTPYKGDDEVRNEISIPGSSTGDRGSVPSKGDDD